MGAKKQAGKDYVYLGHIADQAVCKIPLWDTEEVVERLKQNWVYTTKAAWESFLKGSTKIFMPVEYPTGSGEMIFSSVVYPPQTFSKRKVKFKTK